MIEQLSLRPAGVGGADTAIYSAAYAGTNFGSQASTNIGATTIVKGLTHCRFLVRFDLSEIPPGSAILFARLILTKNTGTYPNGAIFRARRVTQPAWTELGATWNLYDGVNPWATPGGDFDPANSVELSLAAGATILDFEDVSALVIDAVELRSRSLQFLISGNEAATSEFVSIYTSNDANLARRPVLEIQYATPPELSIVDNADGTGASATISGVEAGTNSILHLRPFSGEEGTAAWVAAGMFDAAGELSLPIVPGHYLAYAVANFGGGQVTSPVLYFTVTDGVESIHSRCLAAVQARIRLLALAGIDPDRVLIEKVPVARNLAPEDLPTIIVAPKRAATPADAGTNGLDDVHYDVLVALIDRDNQQPTDVEDLDRQLLWRQQISRAFRNQRLVGVPEVINSAVEPDDGPHEHAWKHELFNTALRLRFTSREPRGF